MSSMKVLFGLGLVLETLGLDVGISRLLLTFLLQYVTPESCPCRSCANAHRLPNSRKSESEADFVGLRLMSYVPYPFAGSRPEPC